MTDIKTFSLLEATSKHVLVSIPTALAKKMGVVLQACGDEMGNMEPIDMGFSRKSLDLAIGNLTRLGDVLVEGKDSYPLQDYFSQKDPL